MKWNFHNFKKTLIVVSIVNNMIYPGNSIVNMVFQSKSNFKNSKTQAGIMSGTGNGQLWMYASDLPENLEEIFPRYYTNMDVIFNHTIVCYPSR